jgi:hypothetical protein
MRAASHAYGIVAGDENGLVAPTTNMTSAFRSPVPLLEVSIGMPGPCPSIDCVDMTDATLRDSAAYKSVN